MSLASIEARASALMSLHKEELTRALAHFEHLAGFLIDEVEDKVRAMVEPAQPNAVNVNVVVIEDEAVQGIADHEPTSGEQQPPEASTDEPQAPTSQGDTTGEPGGQPSASDDLAFGSSDNHEGTAQ